MSYRLLQYFSIDWNRLDKENSMDGSILKVVTSIKDTDEAEDSLFSLTDTYRTFAEAKKSLILFLEEKNRYYEKRLQEVRRLNKHESYMFIEDTPKNLLTNEEADELKGKFLLECD